MIEIRGDFGPEEALHFLGEPQAQWNRAILAERVSSKVTESGKSANRKWSGASEMLQDDILTLTGHCGEILASHGQYVLTFEPCKHPELFPYLVSVLRRSVEHPNSIFDQVISRALSMDMLPDTVAEFVEMRKAKSRKEAIEGVRKVLAADDQFCADLDAQAEVAPSEWAVPEHTNLSENGRTESSELAQLN